MTRDQRLRRVLILICHFTRNLAYYKAGWDGKSLVRNEEFWVGINGNCLDISVLEWCKLFGDKRDPHFWKSIVDSGSTFEDELYSLVGSQGFWDAYVLKMREYRDKFVAHLDNEFTAHIPSMDDALAVSRHYYEWVAVEATLSGAIGGLPSDLEEFYQRHYKEAEKQYRECHNNQISKDTPWRRFINCIMFKKRRG